MSATRQRRSLNAGEIHLWCVSLSISEDCSQKLFATLTGEEKDRAQRYRSPHHRRDFAVGRGLLRAILSQYVEAQPEQIAIIYGRNGKPELANSEISFNLAHSGGLMVIAIALEPTLGIDVEQVRPLPERDAMVRQFFSQTEQQEFFSVPEPERDGIFFRLWTRKEAVLKATGTGWAEQSRQFEPKLSIFDWDPRVGYVAAVAVAEGNWRLIEIPTSRLPPTIEF